MVKSRWNITPRDQCEGTAAVSRRCGPAHWAIAVDWHVRSEPEHACGRASPTIVAAGVKNFIVSMVIEMSSSEHAQNMKLYQARLNKVLVEVRVPPAP